ncbi:MAG: hypothetical protein MHPDNHAH_00975 [Anaerolineales bacterium]|nr:hypothetical protein [Anaerolineales bacterium]
MAEQEPVVRPSMVGQEPAAHPSMVEQGLVAHLLTAALADDSLA